MSIRRVLFVGLGAIGQRHLRNVHARLGDEVDYIAYRTRNLTRTITDDLKVRPDEDFVQKYHLELFSSLEEALAAAPDIAFISNPTRLHIETCTAVANAGCDFFVEKPLADSMDGVEELIQICHGRDLVTYVGYQLRGHPGCKMLKSVVDGGQIGRAVSIRAEVGEYLPGMHPYEDYRESYAARSDLGGGVVLTQIHEIDYLLNIFGPPDSVAAMGGHLSDLEIDVEDSVVATLAVNYQGRRIPISLHMDFLQRPPIRFCRVVGEHGSVTLDFRRNEIAINGAETEVHLFENLERNTMFVQEIEEFIEAVETRSPTSIPADAGVESLRVALAVKQSMDTGEMVHL